jgi:hypothetical protein
MKQRDDPEPPDDTVRLNGIPDNCAGPRRRKWLTQTCADCKRPYKVLATEAHWRDLCKGCYATRMETKAAAKMMAAEPPLNHSANPPQQQVSSSQPFQEAYDVAKNWLGRPPKYAHDLMPDWDERRHNLMLTPAPNPAPLDFGAAIRRAHEQARADLIALASQPTQSLAAQTAYARIRQILKDQRRLWQQRRQWPTRIPSA